MKKSLLYLFTFYFFTVAFAQDKYPILKVTSDIEIIKISDNSYVHVSYTRSPQGDRFSSNGLIFLNNGKALLFDTPMTDSLTKDLVSWINDSLKAQITGFVPNHWHNDCMGGLGYLESIGIESYANELTRNIAASNDLPVPKIGFTDSLIIPLGGLEVVCKYYGAAHTIDNIVVWIPSEKILFCGCMVKELKSEGLGNLVDADMVEYPKTIEKILNDYRSAKFVIPGHGQIGGVELIEHTLDLLSK
jgi:metallo-beta-lactamase class B